MPIAPRPKKWPCCQASSTNNQHTHTYTQVGRAYSSQAQQVAMLSNELNHTTAELGALRARLETSASNGASTQQVCVYVCACVCVV